MIILYGHRHPFPMERKRAATYIPFPVLPFHMQRFAFFILAVTFCVVLLCAGCTSTPGTPGNITPAPVTNATTVNISLAPLALAPADLPAGFTQQSGRQKSADEMSSLAKDLGWQEGYVATYASSGNGTAGSTSITQTITIYDAKNMSSIVSLVDAGEQQQADLAFSGLPLPATGPDTRALSATAVNTTPASTTAGGLSALSSGSGTSAPAEGYIEVIFAKGEILEVLRMTGPGSQYDTLKTLAEAAYAKLG